MMMAGNSSSTTCGSTQTEADEEHERLQRRSRCRRRQRRRARCFAALCLGLPTRITVEDRGSRSDRPRYCVTLTFDLGLWPWLSIPGHETWSRHTHTQVQVQRSFRSNKQTDRQTDRRMILIALVTFPVNAVCNYRIIIYNLLSQWRECINSKYGLGRHNPNPNPNRQRMSPALTEPISHVHRPAIAAQTCISNTTYLYRLHLYDHIHYTIPVCLLAVQSLSW